MAEPVYLRKQNHEYSVGRRLGSGAAGAVYEGRMLGDMAPVALKIGFRGSEASLRDEYRTYRGLEDWDGCAKVLDFQSGLHPVMVMELCISSVADLRRKQRFPVQFTATMGKAMLRRLKELHERGLIHRDVKPNNFLLRRTTAKHDLIIADIGMATRYRDAAGKHLVPHTTRRGTARYMSVEAHNRQAQSCRDDLESLCLPTEQMDEKIKAMKLSTEAQTVCKEAPSLASGLHHVRNLRFTDEPDYALLESLLDDLIDDAGPETLTWESVLGLQHSENPVEATNFVPLFSTRSEPLDAVLARLSSVSHSDEPGQAKANLLREAINIDRAWTRAAFFRTTTLLAETSLYNARALGGIDDLISFVNHFKYQLKQFYLSSLDTIRPSNAAIAQNDPIVRSLDAIRTHLLRAEREVLRTGSSMTFLAAGAGWKTTVQLMKDELALQLPVNGEHDGKEEAKIIAESET